MEAIKANAEARKIIDAALIHAALQYYMKYLSPDIKLKAGADVSRLINEYGTVAKTPLHIDDNGQLVIAGPDNNDPPQVVNLNEL